MSRPLHLRRLVTQRLVVVTILPAAVIAILIWLVLVPQMRTSISLQQLSLARTVAGEISAHLMSGERQLVALADVMVAEEGLSAAQLTTVLDAGCGEGDLFETIYLVEAAANTIRHIGLARPDRFRREDLLGIDLSRRELLTIARQEVRTVWSKTFLSTVSSHLAVAVAVPLPGLVIVGEITLDKLSEYISQLPVEAELLILVIDRRGRIVADSRQKRWGQQLELSSLPTNGNEMSAVPDTRPFSLNGVHMVASMVDVDRLEWKVLVAQPHATAYHPVRSMLLMVAAGLAIALVISLALARLMPKRLLDIVNIYTSHAAAIAHGQYDLKWPPARTVEYSELGENLRSMAGQIHQRERQLRENERRLQELTANVPGVVFQFRASRNHIYTSEFLSRKAIEIFGLDSNSATFIDDFFDHIPEGEKGRYLSSVRGAVDKVAPWNYEGRFIRPDGKPIWFSGHAVPREEGEDLIFYGVLLDITQRKQMELSLRLTQFCFDKASIGIFRIGSDGRILDANEQACASLGYSLEELCNMSVMDIDVNFNAQKWLNHLGHLRKVNTQTIETLHRRKNGDVFPVQIVISLMAYEDMDFLIAFVQDISERRNWEKALAASERRYRSLFEEAPMMYVVTENREAGPHIKDVNNRFLDRLGYRREEVIGTPVTRYYTQASVEELLDKGGYRRAMNGEFQLTERDLLTRDGKVVNTLVHALPEHDDQGKVVGTKAMFMDNTDRKLAEEAVRHLRNYLSNIIDSMPSMLVGVDRQGRVTQWNKQAERVTGLGLAEVDQQPLERVYTPLSEVLDQVEAAIRDRRVIRKLKVPRQHGDAIHYEDIIIFPLVANGVEGAVIRVDDVTERIRLEEMMIQSEKMLSVGGLAAGMAHEINNPLAGILQNTDVLKNRLLTDLPANRRAAETAGIRMDALRHYLELRKLPEMVADIRDSGLRATAIVRNMLSFARKSDRTVSSHDIGTLLDRTLELVETDYDMKKRYDFKKIRIKREYAAADLRVPCESSKIQQVFLNLLKNGAEAMAGIGAKHHPAGEQKPPQFIIRAKANEKWIQVEIEDNGPGLDAKTRRSLFEPFFTTKPVGHGTGLGLSVSYFIITEDHGGEMAVEPGDSGGARFIIRLPKSAKRDVQET